MSSIVVSKSVEDLKNKYIKAWWDSEKTFPPFKEEIGFKEKFVRERQMNRFLKSLFTQLEQCPQNETDQIPWRESLWTMIRNFGQSLGFMESEIHGVFSESLPIITNKFIFDMKSFDPTIHLDKIVQALRNVWIMDILQVLFNIPIEYTPSMFAYSMLYPYTDNYLDSNEISLEDKKVINQHFRSRLEGCAILAENSYEEALFRLVSLIEHQYPRQNFPQVFESLLYIHEAQCRSLTQQKGRTSPYERDILGISVEKGGTSVLADAYLISGSLSDIQIDFTFGYGVLLQLCDDLQDTKQDLKNGHMTIFSQTAEKWPLDEITNALFHFSGKLLDSDRAFLSKPGNEMKAFLKKNIVSLLLEAISQNSNLYSRGYIRSIQKYYPFRMTYTKKLYQKIKNNYTSFQSIHGYSIDEVIQLATESATEH